MADLDVPTQTGPEPRQDRGALALAWFGILGPPAAWAAQLLLSDAFAEVGCEAGGFSSISLVLVVITVAALAIAVAAGVVSFVRFRRAGSREDNPARLERMRFMTLCGCLSSGLFVVLIILGGIVPHLLLSSCAAP
jgi:amino acid transporter